MIRAASRVTELQAFDCDALGCSVISSAAAYGFRTAAVRFWCGNGFAIRLQDSTAVLCGTVDADDREELREFLSCIRADTLLCREENACRLHFSFTNSSLEMELQGDIPAQEKDLCFASSNQTDHDLCLSDMYRLLAACALPDFSVPPFESFYLDMSHRIRHRAVLAAGAQKNHALCACAAADLSPKQALLFSGAALPAVRGSKMFSSVLSALTEKAGKQRTLLLCGKYLRKHYEQMGFSVCGRVVQTPLTNLVFGKKVSSGKS